MFATLSCVSVKTIPSNYSWDSGVPSLNNLQNCVYDANTNTYTGYAPLTIITVDSDITNDSIELTNVSAVRTIDFNDYYNPLDSNICEFSMPAYTTESVYASMVPSIFTSNIITTNSYERVGFSHIYLAPRTSYDGIKLTTKIYNEVTAVQAEYLNNVYIQEQQVSEQKLMKPTVTGLDEDNNAITSLENEVLVTINQDTNILDVKVRVLEINPVATISLISYTPMNLIGPVTARFSSKTTASGSFPIEKLAWDFGDGSPIVSQIRHKPIVEEDSSFISNNTFVNDINDPRNFDVTHTYILNDTLKDTFTVSVTAFAANTGTKSVASLTFPPNGAKLQKYVLDDPNNIKILHCEVTDESKIFFGKYNDDITVWTTDK